MIRRVRNLKRLSIEALDGSAGRVSDVYFDDRNWRVRHLIAETGNRLTGIHVLIPPSAVLEIDQGRRRLRVNMTKLEIERNPVLDADLPAWERLRGNTIAGVARPVYLGFRGVSSLPTPTSRDLHLRSCRHITGYKVLATDGALGHVIDFLVDDETWAISGLLADTTNWRMGKPKLIATSCVDAVGLDVPTINTRSFRRELVSAAAGSFPIAASELAAAQLGDCLGR
jgi:hypothetical protein